MYPLPVLATGSAPALVAPVTGAALESSTFFPKPDWPLAASGLFDFASRSYGPDGNGAIDPLQKAAMLCDPQIYAALWLRRSSILFDEPTFEPCVPYGDPDYDVAQANARLCEFAWRGIDGGLTAGLAACLEADWWRNTVADVIWEEKTFDGKQVRVPGALDVHASGSYILWRRGGRIVGVQPFTMGVGQVDSATGNAVIYDKDKYLIHVFRPSPKRPIWGLLGEWAGTDLARVVWTPYFMKNAGHPLNLQYMELFAVPSFVGTAPEDATQEVALLDRNGQPMLDKVTQEIIKVSPQVAMSKGLENFGGSGSFTVIAPKAKVAMLQAQGDGRIFVNYDDAQDWQILTAILGTGNMTARAKYGSNASAQTGQEAVSSPVALDAMATEAQLQRQCELICEVNCKKKNKHLVPRVRLNAPRRSYYETLFATIMANSPYVDDRLIDGIAERLGAPKPNFEKVAQLAEQKQAQMAQHAKQQAQTAPVP